MTNLDDCTNFAQLEQLFRPCSDRPIYPFFSFTDIANAIHRIRTNPVGAKDDTIKRNCDVMITPAALRKGWERRCDYGKPCCPFEYALEEFR